jgi:hypothetical protein
MFALNVQPYTVKRIRKRIHLKFKEVFSDVDEITVLPHEFTVEFLPNIMS